MIAEFWDNWLLLKKLYDRSLEGVCRTYGVTRTELDILLFLANNPEFDRAADIVERRGLAKSHVSGSVHNLEQRGFLACCRHGGDRKTVHLTIEPAAARITAAGQAAQREFFDAIFAGFTEEESIQWRAMLDKIVRNIQNTEI